VPAAFPPRTLVVVSLSNPREKFWGAIRGLSRAGVYLCGIDLSSFDGFVALLRAGTAAVPSEVFFPMHRVERIEADQCNSDIPSLGERFMTATGRSAESLMAADQIRSVRQP
jgi:hypothetical protein